MTTRTGQGNQRIENARAAFGRASGEFQDLESQFLSVINELLAGPEGRVRNLALMEGLRAQLLMSFATLYRAAVNELADAVIDSFAIDGHPRTGRDGTSPSNPD